MQKERKIFLSESEMPEAWYNIQADLPEPLDPALHPGTLQPIGPQDLAPIFPMELIKQEVSQERWIGIPEEVRDKYLSWRPAPLIRAVELEKALDTPAKIYYKDEGSSPVGSHKLNTALAQAYYNKQAGIKRLATETGAGQWGSALSMACSYFGLECMVYMVKVSYQQKPYRRSFMEVFGGSVIPSPSEMTASGRAVLAEHPDSNGRIVGVSGRFCHDQATFPCRAAAGLDGIDAMRFQHLRCIYGFFQRQLDWRRDAIGGVQFGVDRELTTDRRFDPVGDFGR